MEILLADRSHIPYIASLERATFAEPWSESALDLFFGGDGFCVVCMCDGKLVGYCTVATVLDEAQIINVATDANYRKRGVACGVLSFMLDECLQRGISSVSLEVREGNAAAIALYERLNFESVGIRKNFYTKPRENALVMIKRLD